MEGGILASELTCTTCTVSTVCASCKEKPLAVYFEESDSEEEADGDDDDQQAKINDADFDASDESEDEDECDALINSDLRTGDVVWAKFSRTWYPARIACMSEVPESLAKRIRASKAGLVPLLWYGEARYGSASIRYIDTLGENRCDAARAAVSVDILGRYNAALADLNKD